MNHPKRSKPNGTPRWDHDAHNAIQITRLVYFEWNCCANKPNIWHLFWFSLEKSSVVYLIKKELSKFILKRSNLEFLKQISGRVKPQKFVMLSSLFKRSSLFGTLANVKSVRPFCALHPKEVSYVLNFWVSFVEQKKANSKILVHQMKPPSYNLPGQTDCSRKSNSRCVAMIGKLFTATSSSPEWQLKTYRSIFRERK